MYDQKQHAWQMKKGRAVEAGMEMEDHYFIDFNINKLSIFLKFVGFYAAGILSRIIGSL